MLVTLEDFQVNSQFQDAPVQCRFLRLAPAIATRGTDALDCIFQVGEEEITVAVSHAGIVEFSEFAGKSLNDQEVVDIAACFLRRTLEAGGSGSTPLWLDGKCLVELASELGAPKN